MVTPPMLASASPPPRSDAGVARRGRRVTWRCALGVVGATAVLAYLAFCRLRGFPYPLDAVAAARGAAEVVDQTGRAALATWAIVGAMVLALARLLGGRHATWSTADRLTGGVVVLWAIAYVALLALGPLGLFTPTVLRVLAVAILAIGALRPAGRFVRARWTPGGWILVLAIGLMIGPLLLLQLASPVSPFMDVLGYIAPVQKIVTFRYYDAYANDAAGLWAPTRQVLGFDALFAFIALVAGLPAHLTISSLIVPFAIFQLVALYRVVAVAAGRIAGGMAALFLLQTFAWRRTPDMRSTGLAFAVVAVGLAFLFATRRDTRKTALGGLALGVGLTITPLIGGIGMQLAAIAATVEFLDLRRPLVPRIAALTGATLLALPQLCVSVSLHPPPLVLPLLATVGVACLALLYAKRETPRERAAALGAPAAARARAWRITRLLVVVSLPIAVLAIDATGRYAFRSDTWFGYELLMILAVGGIAVAAQRVWERPGMAAAAAIPAIALWLGIIDHDVASPLRFTSGALETRSLAAEVTSKMIYYWWPYWLAAAAGTWFGMLARRWALGPAIVLALVLVVYPLRHVDRPVDYDGPQFSLAENWGFQLANAARGYHAGRQDRRWVLDAAWRELAGILLDEVAAGRLGYYDHVVQISPSIDTFELALWTGISVDLLTPRYDPQSIWTGNGRARGLDAVPTALASRPRWVIVHAMSPAQFPELASYEEVFAREGLLLYRAPG